VAAIIASVATTERRGQGRLAVGTPDHHRARVPAGALAQSRDDVAQLALGLVDHVAHLQRLSWMSVVAP